MTLQGQDLPGSADVSRETTERLQAYLRLVEKWNPAINLVSPASLGQGWARHIQDSLQLWALGGRAEGHWVDLGSGGGFPGMVMAIVAQEAAPGFRVTLVDSDARKCVFLREVARSLALEVDVKTGRIEEMAPLGADVISARALAPLTELLGFAERHGGPGALALFPKGRSFQEELDLARRHWQFDCDVVPSVTDDSAVILAIRNLRHG